MIVASVSTVYVPAGRVTAVNTDAFFAPSFSNYYDAVGNRIGVIESNGSSVSFSYDASYQLINEVRTGTNPYNISYTFDPLGNRLLQNAGGQITTRTFNAANEMLTAMSPTGVITSRSYDTTGNLTLSNTAGVLTTFTWNGDNRLLSYTKPGLAETYTYREDGLRASKTSAGSLRNFSWDGQNMAVATDGSLNQLERQTDAPGEWGSLVYQLQDGYFTAPLFDAQGSTRWAFSFQGSSFYINLPNYDAFGNLVSTPPAQPDPLKYVGQYGYYTDATGLNYVRNRYYDPVNGTWISRDPIGFEGGDWNLTRYVGNQPASFVDPSGYQYTADTCSGGTKASIDTACNCLSNLSTSDWAAIGSCIQYVSKRLGVSQCAVPWSSWSTPNCYNAFCSCGNVTCCGGKGGAGSCGTGSDGKEICAPGSGDCAQVLQQGSYIPCAGEIYLCRGGYHGTDCQSTDCLDKHVYRVSQNDIYRWTSDNVGSPVAWTIFHEIGHLCGVQHTIPNTGQGQFLTCNDIFANCIYQQCGRLNGRLNNPNIKLPIMKVVQ